MTKITMEAKIDESCVNVEDGGSAVIIEPIWEIKGADDNLFIRIQSWDEDIWEHPDDSCNLSTVERAQLGHQSIHELIGKKIRVTIEVIDEE